MSTDLVESTTRALRIKARTDLHPQQQSYQGRRYWLVKDPLRLKYYRFQEEEYRILQLLDGERSLVEIQTAWQEEFRPQKITTAELTQFISTLHRNCLVVATSSGQGSLLLDRHLASRRSAWKSALTNILAIRIPVADPDRILARMNRYVGWIFSVEAIAAAIFLVSAALILVMVQWQAFQERLPRMQEFFAAENWIYLALTLGVTKVLHELGHGLSCKRLGGECHETGVMLLLFTPCLYCDVSDSWLLPSRWQRAGIAMAGMYVEIVLASLATLLWWFTVPGTLNYLCLNVMFVCSVSTLLFNANPLLRFDGYYVLSDVLEIPNLRQKASSVVKRSASRWMFGIQPAVDPFLPERKRGLFALYAIAAATYRWWITGVILWVLYQVLKPYGLQVVGQVIVVAAMYALVARPVWKLLRFFLLPTGSNEMNRGMTLLKGSGLTAALLLLVLIPLPYSITGALHLEPADAQRVHADVPGRVSEIHVQPGTEVFAGQRIVTLANEELELLVSKLEGQQRELEARLTTLRQRQFNDDSAALSLLETEKSLASIKQQVAKRQEDLLRLEITAPVAGTLIAAPTSRETAIEMEAAKQNGTPLEVRDTGAYLNNGALICQVGDPARVQAIIAIDQADIEFVTAGQEVELHFTQQPGRIWNSHIEQVAHLDRNARRGKAARREREEVTDRLLDTIYEANAPIESEQLFLGTTGTAQIRVGNRSIAWRAWRAAMQTFRFYM